MPLDYVPDVLSHQDHTINNTPHPRTADLHGHVTIKDGVKSFLQMNPIYVSILQMAKPCLVFRCYYRFHPNNGIDHDSYGDGSVMVWEGIHWDGNSDLVELNITVRAQSYGDLIIKLLVLYRS